MASCPAAAPASGASCGPAQTCFYEDCAGAGRTVASCAGGGAWSVESGPCTTVLCQGLTCPAGQICMMSGGGALLVSCVENTCAGAAIGCDCLQSCAGMCFVGGSLQSGVTINCNTCASHQCA